MHPNYSKVMIERNFLLFFISLQETQSMALALFFQPTLRLFFPEIRCHKRFLELTGMCVTASSSGKDCGEGIMKVEY